MASAATRRIVVNVRTTAMTGNLDRALSILDETRRKLRLSEDSESELKILSVKAELLFLNCQEHEAINIFTNDIEPRVSGVSRQTLRTLEYNRNDLAMYSLEPASSKRFYELYDRSHITSEKLFDAEKTVYALEAAAEGKHYEALPALWREALETYRDGTWRYFRRAASRLADEFLELGWSDIAAFHAILALDEDAAKRVSGQILLQQNRTLVESLVNKVLLSANLKRHAIIGCLLITETADGIPDKLIHPVCEWLLSKVAEAAPNLAEMKLMQGSWDAIGSIANRLDEEDALRVIETATTHELWTASNFFRKHLIEAVDAALDRLPISELPLLAERSIALATSAKGDIDYPQSIDLLGNIAERGGNEVKAFIGNALYPTQQAYDPILIQVAERFGRALADENQANEMAQRVAAEIRNQVRYGKEDDTPREGYGRVTAGSGDQTVSVSLSSFVGLRAVLNHRTLLSTESVDLLASAIVGMVAEPENIPANKTALIDCLMTLEDRLTPEAANLLFEALAPIANGAIPKPKIMKAFGDPNDPLNRFKMNVGAFSQVQGQALHAVSYLDQLNEGKFAEQLEPIFIKVITEADPEVRRAAFGALRWFSAVSEPLIMSLLMGTRDPDPRTAEAAYVALARHKTLHIAESLWHQLMYALTMTAQSPLWELRRAAAYTISALRNQCPEHLTEQLDNLSTELANDICYSVRRPLLQDNKLT